MLLALSAWYLWGGLLGLIWFVCLVSAGVLTWKNGHKIMFFLGFLLPLLLDRRGNPQQEARSVSARLSTLGPACLEPSATRGVLT